MRAIRGILVLGLLGALAGCAGTPIATELELQRLLVSDVDPSSAPAFLETEQQASDLLPVDLEGFSMDPETTRYQGEWEGRDIYLGVGGTSTVYVISINPEEPSDWGAGSSIGNTPIGSSSWIDGVEVGLSTFLKGPRRRLMAGRRSPTS
ncbi:MAG: hypothetical protein JWP85_1538 [Rhodoglobus sp.]|nr:hypothetical protein [Rhodoglobus sp.]